jgi:hypothetical protein
MTAPTRIWWVLMGIRDTVTLSRKGGAILILVFSTLILVFSSINIVHPCWFLAKVQLLGGAQSIDLLITHNYPKVKCS